MLDLDELKQYIQNNTNEQFTGSNNATNLENTYSKLLKTNPQSPINKIQKSMLFEIGFALFLLLIFGYFIVFTSIWSIRVYLGIVLLLCCLSLIPLLHIYLRIRALNNVVLPVKDNLLEVYTIMQLFVKRYFQFTMGLIPVFFILAISLGFYEGRHHEIPAFESIYAKAKSNYPSLGLGSIILLIIGYMAMVSVGAYYFTKWYLKKLYGTYLKELKQLINELEE